MPGSTRNSISARWASKSSTGRNCRRCSVHVNIQDCRNSTARRYTSSSAHTAVCRRLLPSDRKRERCCSAADDSRAGSRSHANDGCAARVRARRTQWLAAAPRELQTSELQTKELHLMRSMCGTLLQHTRSALRMRQSPGLVFVRRAASPWDRVEQSETHPDGSAEARRITPSANPSHPCYTKAKLFRTSGAFK